ncbi:SGNH/GDSL hydrolase family protein [Haloactinomyces albus]|uniref:Lysophospholipase L1-like esterase n=1 Tax=Haloactinomyces albus TaxID=1352928 RepID=A0AAE4CNC0_9ACTN|nr:SGNH/GDSL hydrolase family protein [Haloactinomyces albus]MDR7303744.1 lysophospholipase L1-like esterase [Haloactinomyces albus]
MSTFLSSRTTFRASWWHCLTVATAAILLLPPSSSATDHTPPTVGGGDWVGSWAAAVTPPADDRPEVQRFDDTTLRQVVHLSVGGDSLRLRLTNVHGTKPLSVGAVTVAVRDGAAGTPLVQPSTLTSVTFDGESSATIPAGTEWVSDPITMAVPDNTDLVISMYLPHPTGRASVHYEGMATTFAAPGNATANTGDAYSTMGTSRYFLDGVDVRSGANGSVVFFGDSITDGVKSTIDAHHRYPDVVADRLLKRPDPRELGVLNAGLSANRLLTDAGLGGESALARFERDVLGQTGVQTVVLLEGINDIHNSYGAVEPEQLIRVYEQLIIRAHEAGISVVAGTITPFEGAPRYTAEGEAVRQAVNTWIRNSGKFDAVVDFDAVLRDPAHPTRLAPRYDTGDHVHPNDAGLAAMAAAIELDTLD